MTTPLPPPDFRKATFLTSAARVDQCPPDSGAEVAFAGRSNAGKSSCINALTQNGKLARASKTPGRTRLINFFTLSPDQRLVDLPGYGYAKVSHEMREEWQEHLADYLHRRESLRGLVLLMDIRHPMKDLDRHMIDWAVESQLPVHVVLTKADKLNRGPAQQVLLQVKRELAGIPGVSCQLLSSTARTGIDELAAMLTGWLAS